MESIFRGKRILLTGTGSGIGNALSKTLYELGAHVIAVSKCSNNLDKLKSECPNITTIQTDLRDWQNTRKALEQVQCLDGLVNNAGVAFIKPFEELTESDFDNTFDVNIKAVFNVTQALTKKLKDGSCIVNISSLASTKSFAGHVAYAASKAAVDSLTRSLAQELGPRKIRVNSINPTVILTKMGRENWSDPKKSEPLLDHIPLHRFGEVEDVVKAVLYLLSDSSSFVNGHHLLLEGGYSAA